MTSITSMLNRHVTPARGELRTGLSQTDLQRLTIFKWMYSLEAQGYSTHEAHGLAFHRWLYVRGRIGRWQ
jgi:hypothetical protein